MPKRWTSRPPIPFSFFKETFATLLHTSWQDEPYCQMLTSVAVLQHRVISFRSIQPPTRIVRFNPRTRRTTSRHRSLNVWYTAVSRLTAVRASMKFHVPSYKHNHEHSFVGGRINVVSPVARTRDWRDPAERRLATSSRYRESGGGGGEWRRGQLLLKLWRASVL